MALAAGVAPTALKARGCLDSSGWNRGPWWPGDRHPEADLRWGRTVTLASRMQSHGVPDRIQVTEEFRRRLRHAYTFQYRGLVDVKGRGPTPTWWLLGRKAPQLVGSLLGSLARLQAGEPAPSASGSPVAASSDVAAAARRDGGRSRTVRFKNRRQPLLVGARPETRWA
jgi:hypothetical protein